jgi:hypothetical protein
MKASWLRQIWAVVLFWQHLAAWPTAQLLSQSAEQIGGLSQRQQLALPWLSTVQQLRRPLVVLCASLRREYLWLVLRLVLPQGVLSWA